MMMLMIIHIMNHIVVIYKAKLAFHEIVKNIILFCEPNKNRKIEKEQNPKKKQNTEQKEKKKKTTRKIGTTV